MAGVNCLNELKANPMTCVGRHAIAGVAEGNSFSMMMMKMGANGLFKGSTTESRHMKLPIACPVTAAPYSAVGTKLTIEAPMPGEPDNGLRYLPYQADRCWYMRMDDAAQVFVTAELTGCDIHVFGTWQNPWICHCNANASGGDDAANGPAKLKMALDAMGAEPTASQVRLGGFVRAEYGKEYSGAFFVGARGTGGWTFFGCLKQGSGYSYTVIGA